MGLNEWLIVALVLVAFVVPVLRRQFVRYTGQDPQFLRLLEYGALIVIAIGFFLLVGRLMWFATILVFALGMLVLIWFLLLRPRRR